MSQPQPSSGVDSIRSGFAANVRGACLRKGWSLGQLAVAAKLTKEGVRQLELPAADPKLSTVAKVALALGVSVAEILGLHPQPSTPVDGSGRRTKARSDRQRRREADKADDAAFYARLREESQRREEAAERRREEESTRLDEAIKRHQANLDEIIGQFRQVGQRRGQQLAAAAATVGLSWPCAAGEVRAAYKRLARTRHPDRGGTHDDFVALTAAHDLLLAACE